MSSNSLKTMLGGECDDDFCDFVMDALIDFTPEDWYLDSTSAAPNFETGYGFVTLDDVKTKILAQKEE